MSKAATYTPHPNYTEDTQARKQPKYQVAEDQKTFGEKFYDVMNYGVVGYGVNLGLSVAITEFMLHGGGKPAWDASDRLGKKVFGTFMSAEKAATTSAVTQKYFWLTSGGTVLMAPLLWAENRKTKLTYLANRQWAPQTIAEDDPNKYKTASEILSKNFNENNLPQPVEIIPKHGILNALWRRGLGIALVTGWGNVLHNTVGESFIEDKGLKMIAKGSENLGKTLEKEPLNRWARWTIADAVNTVITSGAIFFTRGGSDHKEEQAKKVIQGDIDQPDEQMHASHSQEPQIHVKTPEIHANHHARNFKETSEITPKASHVEVATAQEKSTPTLAV